MPQSIIIAAPRTPEIWEILGSLQPTGAHVFSRSEPREIQLQSTNPDWYIRIGEMSEPDEIALDYMTNDDLDEGFRAIADEKTFVSVTFNDYHVVRAFLIELLSALDPKRIGEHWIDNDYGVVLNAADFLHKLRSTPEWDWRTAHP